MEAATVSPTVPRGRSLPGRAWAWLRRNALLIFAGLAVAYMLIPIAVIALFSFDTTDAGELDFAFDGFTLEYWKDAFANEDVNDSMITSLQLAALSTIGATVIGTLMAMALVRYEFFGRRATNLLIILPMATPEIVIGAALLSMFVLPPFNEVFTLGFQTLLVAHIMFSISFVVVVVRSRLIGFDRSLEEAAADLGRPAADDVPDGHPAPAGAGDRRRRAARVRPLARRLRHLQPQLRARPRPSPSTSSAPASAASPYRSTSWRRCSSRSPSSPSAWSSGSSAGPSEWRPSARSRGLSRRQV